MNKPEIKVRKGKAARPSQPHRDRSKYTRKSKHGERRYE